MTRRDFSWRVIQMGLCAVVLVSLFVGCGGSSRDSGNEESSPLGVDTSGLQFNPNTRIGEVVWINERGDFVVVRMDAPRSAFEPAFLLALDAAGSQMAGVLIGGGDVEGRSFGARVVEGTIPEGAEIRLPGPEWTEYLFNRYNQTERVQGQGSQGPQ